jgi:two-component system NtrC family sensor kinase
LAALVRQRYEGRIEWLARQPVAAAVIATGLAGGLLFLSAWSRVVDAGLAGFDYALQYSRVRVISILLEAVSAGLAAQVAAALRPGMRPAAKGSRVSPLRRSLSWKLLIVVVPLILMMTFGLLYAVTTITLREARAEAERDLSRDARSAGQAIPEFIYTGQGLLAEFVEDERLSYAASNDLEGLLESNLRIGAFFDHLMLFGTDGQLVSTYPPAPAGDPELTAQEEALLTRVLQDGAPQISSGHQSHRDEALLTFLMPTPEDSGLGCLLGRTHLQSNPTMERILAGLQRTEGMGEGFVIDASGHIVVHPDPGMVLSEWQGGQYEACISEAGPQGVACEGRHPVRNSRELLYYLPAEGYPWAVVVRLPYEVVLDQARAVAVPLLALLGVFGGVLVIAIVLLVGRMTDPLKRLANAAERIAGGTLGEPIEVNGADEVGRLGLTFEDMRARLQGRMSDLSLLLEVSQAVSSTLDLATGLSFVLEGALRATGADMARAVLVGEGRLGGEAVSRGADVDGAGPVERALIREVVDSRRPLVLPDQRSVKAITGSKGTHGAIEAAAAMPVCTQDRVLAVIWIGYSSAHGFEKSKLDFLAMLTSQVAVLMENARLFQVVEGERTRLAAILESVSDVVLVTDRQGQVLLVNSAAERELNIEPADVLGRPIEEAGLPPEVVSAVAEPSSTKGSLKELFLPKGRVLYADVSEIETADGDEMGRVAVMRDITRYKELDEMKSEFLATVSHDLRAPLTFMRGYAQRLEAVGELNEKQQSYVQNILQGVERIDSLVLDLLDLSRIEAGLGMQESSCNLGVLVAEAVSSLRPRATEKGISLQIHPPIETSNGGKEALVSGDRALLRQVFINLLDNAIKYTPEGGKVAAGLSVEGENGSSRATVRVADTGIGIAPDEQVRLFEKFYRTKRGNRSGAAGTGLGLAIVKSVVERHQGKVWVESKPDKGSAFYVTLPLVNGVSLSGQRMRKAAVPA